MFIKFITGVAVASFFVGLFATLMGLGNFLSGHSNTISPVPMVVSNFKEVKGTITGEVIPKYKVGECIGWNDHDEFEPHTWIYKINKIGPKSYQLYLYVGDGKFSSMLPNSERISSVDSGTEFVAVECPTGAKYGR